MQSVDISSPQNQQIKDLIALRDKKKLRGESQSFVIEGVREVERACERGFRLKKIFYCPEIGPLPSALVQQKVLMLTVSRNVFSKIAVREDSGGVVAIAQIREPSLTDLRVNPRSIFLLFEDIEKPGNLGAVLRTADAAGVSAVLVTGASVDVFNPNTIRASVGAVFSVPVIQVTTDEAQSFFTKQKIKCFATSPRNAVIYHQASYIGPTALIFGSEAHGLSERWLHDNNISQVVIPMLGIGDSLNVSVAAAVLTFEARRQLGFS